MSCFPRHSYRLLHWCWWILYCYQIRLRVTNSWLQHYFFIRLTQSTHLSRHFLLNRRQSCLYFAHQTHATRNGPYYDFCIFGTIGCSRYHRSRQWKLRPCCFNGNHFVDLLMCIGLLQKQNQNRYCLGQSRHTVHVWETCHLFDPSYQSCHDCTLCCILGLHFQFNNLKGQLPNRTQTR